MIHAVLTRRAALAGVVSLGFTIDLMATCAFADNERGIASRRLVVIICRGGLDGLSLSPPVADPDYAGLRGPIAIAPFGAPNGALRLDETFGLHPSLTSVYALAQKGEARIAPAVATPDRERSHFEAQDVLESGAGKVYASSSGWLNRALEAMAPQGAVTAISVGPTAPLILRGPIEATSWSPGGMAQTDRRLPMLLQDLYAHDPLLGPALAEGLATEAMAKTAVADAALTAAPPPSPQGDMQPPAMGGQMNRAAPPRQAVSEARKIGATLAGFMVQPGGVRVAAVSLDNFDTHANQGAGEGQLATRLAYVDAFLDGLHTGLGPSWPDTMVDGDGVWAYRACQRNQRHRPRHCLYRARLGWRIEARRDHRRLADSPAGELVRKSRHLPNPRYARTVQGRFARSHGLRPRRIGSIGVS